MNILLTITGLNRLFIKTADDELQLKIRFIFCATTKTWENLEGISIAL
jgi:hypothetical protein